MDTTSQVLELLELGGIQRRAHRRATDGTIVTDIKVSA
jgi:hypothetical protein